MSLLREIGAELLGLFLSDAWLTGGLLAVVAATALLIAFAPAAPVFIAAGVLVAGSVAVLAGAVALTARRQKRAARRDR